MLYNFKYFFNADKTNKKAQKQFVYSEHFFFNERFSQLGIYHVIYVLGSKCKIMCGGSVESTRQSKLTTCC